MYNITKTSGNFYLDSQRRDKRLGKSEENESTKNILSI